MKNTFKFTSLVLLSSLLLSCSVMATNNNIEDSSDDEEFLQKKMAPHNFFILKKMKEIYEKNKNDQAPTHSSSDLEKEKKDIPKE